MTFFVLRILCVFSALSAVSVLSALAQTSRLTGQVLTADSAPVRGARVVLHRIGPTAQGPIDSVHSGSRGNFQFVFQRDTAASYLVSARYAGIEYFSAAVSGNVGRSDTTIRLVVYDTSSTVPVTLQARHFVLTRPGTDGARGMLDLLILQNSGRFTRVAPDTIRSSWTALLPRGTIGLEVAESDVSPNAVTRRGDSLIVTASLAPGEKQLTVQYQVPAGRRVVELPAVPPGSTVNVMVEEREVAVSGLTLVDSQVIQDRSFRRWTGVSTAGGVIRLTLPGRSDSAPVILAILVTGLAVILGGLGWYLYLRRAQASRLIPADQLLDAIAMLDLRYQGRQGETPSEEWRAYQAERSRLKMELEASLAAEGWTR